MLTECWMKVFINQNLEMAFKKGTHEEVAADLTETLKKLQREGITEKIVTKYGLDADEILPEGEQNE